LWHPLSAYGVRAACNACAATGRTGHAALERKWAAAQVSRKAIFERFADKTALAKAVSLPVELVSWDIPTWTDWCFLYCCVGLAACTRPIRRFHVAWARLGQPAGRRCSAVRHAAATWHRTV
jgi:hypothetical protein